MDYFGIIKRAWRITWQNKFLWIFGFFAAGVSGASFNFSFPSGNTGEISETQISQISQSAKDFFSQYWFILFFIALAAFFVFIIFFVLNIVSQGALIGCADKIEKGAPTGVKDGLQIGLSKFWKIFGLRILLAVTIFLALVILAGPTIALFIFGMPGRAIILMLLALVIFVPLAVVLSFILNYSLRFLVLKNAKIIDSLSLGFNLLKKNILSTVVITLILILAGFVMGIAALTAGLVIFIPALFLGIAAYFVGQWVGVAIVAIIAILLLFVFMSSISAVFNTFSSTTWTLVFLEMEKKS